MIEPRKDNYIRMVDVLTDAEGNIGYCDMVRDIRHGGVKEPFMLHLAYTQVSESWSDG